MGILQQTFAILNVLLQLIFFVLKYLNQFSIFLFIYLQILDYVHEGGQVKDKQDKTTLIVFN